MPIQKNKRAWNILQILARRQKNRVPAVKGRSGTTDNLPQYNAKEGSDFSLKKLDDSPKTPEEIQECLTTAYGKENFPHETDGFMAGQPIPGDPGTPPPGEKRELPPPPSPEQGGAPPV